MADVKKLKKTDLTKINKIVQTLLGLLGIDKAKTKIEDKDNVVYINIDYPDSGILIGFQGESLFSLQLILSLIIYKNLGFWQKIVVDIGDYREKRAESLQKLALNTAQKVKFSGEQIMFRDLNPADRRVIHMALADNPDVKTESQGEGKDRVLLVMPKN